MTCISVEADFYVPPSYDGPTEAILPDSVVAATAQRYALVESERRGIDPACGSYTIPRVLRTLGGTCVDAADIDPSCCATAKDLANLLPAIGDVINSDVMHLPQRYAYDYVYTSLPFAWFFEHGTEPNHDYAWALGRLLRNRGLLIIDSADTAVRNGQEIPLADRQIDYFEANEFTLIDRITYETKTSKPGFDTRFTELAFILDPLGSFVDLKPSAIMAIWQRQRSQPSRYP